MGVSDEETIKLRSFARIELCDSTKEQAIGILARKLLELEYRIKELEKSPR